MVDGEKISPKRREIYELTAYSLKALFTKNTLVNLKHTWQNTTSELILALRSTVEISLN